MSTRMRMGFARSKIVEKFGSQSNFAQQLGVSRRTLFNWIKEGEVPPRYISPFFELLQLSGKEEAYILNIPEVELTFQGEVLRSDKAVSEITQSNIRVFFNLFFPEIHRQKSLGFLKAVSLENVIKTLREWFGLHSDEPAVLNSVLGHLNYLGIPVVFSPLIY